MPCPRVSYANLDVTLLAPPREVVGPGARVSNLSKSAKTARPYATWVKETIVANTTPGEKVLVVVHKNFLAHEYLPNRNSLGADAYDLEGRQVAFINWGYGIGSNRWKEATTVFLFGEFHVPRRATAAIALGLLDQPAGVPRLDGMGTLNTQDEVFRLLRDGHLLRWEKQLAMRGNARNITGEGVCGRQRLFVTSEFGRFIQYREALFPDARVSIHPSVRQRGLQGAEALADLLMTAAEAELTTQEVGERCGVSLGKHGARLLSSPTVSGAMEARGWRYVRGGGRGRPSRFVRADDLNPQNDNAEDRTAEAA